MPKLTKEMLQKILTRRLKLRNPHFIFERMGPRLSGSVIDDRFVRMNAWTRQKMIWDALDRELGDDSARRVGTILAYSTQEWDLPLEGQAQSRNRRSASKARSN